MMVKQVKVSNFTEVKGIVSAAAKCYNDVGVHDMKGSIADAKSILGKEIHPCPCTHHADRCRSRRSR